MGGLTRVGRIKSLSTVKVFLDDEREASSGWLRVFWPEEAIALHETGQVNDISRDHDLGDDLHGTGYDVILWIEEAVITRNYAPPKIQVHSRNSSAHHKIELGIESIIRHAKGAANTGYRGPYKVCGAGSGYATHAQA